MERRAAGFTIIEILIVVTVIAIVASLSVPAMLASKMSANETAALATLRGLLTAQAQVQSTARIDADNDGIGEYGTFLELSGSVGVRTGYTPGSGTTPATADFSSVGAKLTPQAVPQSLSAVNSVGFVNKGAYVFMLFLPDSGTPTGFVHEVGPAAAPALDGGTRLINVSASETMWCVYAQPMTWGTSGVRRFFVSPAGDILQSQNERARKDGISAPIQASAAFTGPNYTSPPALGTLGQDGDVWKGLR